MLYANVRNGIRYSRNNAIITHLGKILDGRVKKKMKLFGKKNVIRRAEKQYEGRVNARELVKERKRMSRNCA